MAGSHSREEENEWPLESSVNLPPAQRIQSRSKERVNIKKQKAILLLFLFDISFQGNRTKHENWEPAAEIDSAGG